MEIDKNDRLNIDNAFRRAMLIPEEEADKAMALWENHLVKKVAKQNFYKFGFTHVNIFSISAVVISAAVICIGAFYYLSHSTTSASPQNEDSSQKELLIDSSTAGFTTHGADQKKSAGNRISTEEKGPSPSITIDSLSNELVPQASVDSTLKAVEPNPVSDPVLEEKKETAVKPIKIVKKTIVIEKRDTLEKVDTIRSKKEWRKASKNH